MKTRTGSFRKSRATKGTRRTTKATNSRTSRSTTTTRTTRRTRVGARAARGSALSALRCVVGPVLEPVPLRRHERKPADCVGDEEEGPPSLVLGGVGPFVFPQDDESREIVARDEIVRRAARRAVNRVAEYQ